MQLLQELPNLGLLYLQKCLKAPLWGKGFLKEESFSKKLLLKKKSADNQKEWKITQHAKSESNSKILLLLLLCVLCNFSGSD